MIRRMCGGQCRGHRSKRSSPIGASAAERILRLSTACKETDPMGVKAVAAKLQGRHLLSDRRAIEITAATPIGRQLTALS